MTVLIVLGAAAVLLFLLVSCWKLFEKAGQQGWKAVIPFVNLFWLGHIQWFGCIALFEYLTGLVAGLLGGLFLTMDGVWRTIGWCVLATGAAAVLFLRVRIGREGAKRFGQSAFFGAVFLGILQPVGVCILGWNKAAYRPPVADKPEAAPSKRMSQKRLERAQLHGTGQEYFRRLDADIVRDKWLFLLLLPGLLYFLIFKYLPMFGIVIAFENYVPFSGVLGSQWVGFKWFEYFFRFPAWVTYLTNTLILSLMNIIFYFPAPIILALLLNEMRSLKYKKLLQTLLYVPHFISIVIVVSITFVMFGTSGIVYRLTQNLLGNTINYMGSPDTFRWMIIGQTVWKETGWGTIIFLAALTNVDTQLYEAAMVDGAGRLRRLWHITLPAIRSTIVLMLILRMGSVLDTGYDHLILMANPLNRKVSQTLDVFVYQQGIQSGQFSYASAIGLMKAIVSVTLVVGSNKIAHLMGEQGLY